MYEGGQGGGGVHLVVSGQVPTPPPLTPPPLVGNSRGLVWGEEKFPIATAVPRRVGNSSLH